jgi:hypothetical protein
MLIRTAVLLALVGLCASCATFSRVPKDTGVPTNDAIFVIGSSPEHFRVWVYPAQLVEKDGAVTVRYDVPGMPALVANPENGFLVGQVSGGATLAIGGVRLVRANETFGPGYSACGGHITMVFTAPKGQVVYVGHVRLGVEGKELFARYSENFAAARRHVDANYPNLRGRLVQHGHQLMTTHACPNPGTQVITVPARR